MTTRNKIQLKINLPLPIYQLSRVKGGSGGLIKDDPRGTGSGATGSFPTALHYQKGE
ncbi:hypothetical protein [Pseudoalteromonas sp. HM-SA03]|uniref:hypothetical protein n=1 Tax=Pseudoalteromonas sp. HM-SA03 TaxID=2029678 RepID=UPI00159522D3|nr:hypothetical protein [Pseudoalteromonas sp. HM-SA03]